MAAARTNRVALNHVPPEAGFCRAGRAAGAAAAGRMGSATGASGMGAEGRTAGGAAARRAGSGWARGRRGTAGPPVAQLQVVDEALTQGRHWQVSRKGQPHSSRGHGPGQCRPRRHSAIAKSASDSRSMPCPDRTLPSAFPTAQRFSSTTQLCSMPAPHTVAPRETVMAGMSAGRIPGSQRWLPAPSETDVILLACGTARPLGGTSVSLGLMPCVAGPRPPCCWQSPCRLARSRPPLAGRGHVVPRASDTVACRGRKLLTEQQLTATSLLPASCYTS